MLSSCPTFETGRLAGLGLDPGGAPHATFSAWADYPGRPQAANYPIYYRWYFRTGALGDFEYLVELLKPQPVDPQVGIRDMDVQDPGSNIPGITNPALGGVLRLGGALQVPDADLDPAQLAQRQVYENWDQPYPDDFEKALAAFVNLPDDYAAQSAAAANAAANLGPGRQRRSRPADHRAAVLPVARAHPAAADQPRRHSRAESRQLGAPAEPRPALPRARGAGRAGGGGQRRSLHGRRLAADRRRAGRQRAHPAPAPGHRRLLAAAPGPPAAAGGREPRARVRPACAGLRTGPGGRRDAGAHPVVQPDPARADLGRDAPRRPPGRAADALTAVHRHGDPGQPAHAGQRGRGERRPAKGGPVRHRHRRPGGARGRHAGHPPVGRRAAEPASVAADRAARPGRGGAGRRAGPADHAAAVRDRYAGRCRRPGVRLSGAPAMAGLGRPPDRHHRGRADARLGRDAAGQPGLRPVRSRVDVPPLHRRKRQPDRRALQGRAARLVPAAAGRPGGRPAACAGPPAAHRRDHGQRDRRRSGRHHPASAA